MDSDVLISDYLRRLRGAAEALPATRREELLAEVQEHIESALSEAGTRDELTARNVLERLGPPEEIVDAETGPGESPPGPQVVVIQRSGWGALEIAAILFLTVGAVFLPVIGPVIGIVLVWASSVWTTRQKWIATIIMLVLLLLPIVLLFNVGGMGGGVTGPMRQ